MTVIANASPTIGWVAMATGVLGLLALIFLVVFFAGVQVFGPLNDITIGLTAVSSFLLALALHSDFRAQSPVLSWAALVIAAIGALVVVAGTVLVVFRLTGYVLSGLYMATGNALIGVWLLALVWSSPSRSSWPQGLIVFGMVAGAIMVLGLATLPGIVHGVDSWEAAPWYVLYVGMAGSLGWLMLYPIWCLLLGRAAMAR